MDGNFFFTRREQGIDAYSRERSGTPWLGQKKSDWNPLVSSGTDDPASFADAETSGSAVQAMLNNLLVVDMFFRGPWAWDVDTVKGLEPCSVPLNSEFLDSRPTAEDSMW